MPEPMDFEKVLVEQLERINRSVRAICRHSGFGQSDTEDCCAWVVSRLIEDDYAILRKFEGRSQLSTFLTVVVARLVRDWRTERWGRWRSSAEAKRLGPVACQLEVLVYRDRLSLRESIEFIRSSSTLAPSEAELTGIFRKIPIRRPIRPREVDEQAAASAMGDDRADRPLDESEFEAERDSLWRALHAAIERLPPTDALMVKMRYFDGLSVADIARALGLEQKPMYRQLERAMAHLRSDLERSGVNLRRLKDFLGDDER